jgi:hypothetical protein
VRVTAFLFAMLVTACTKSTPAPTPSGSAQPPAAQPTTIATAADPPKPPGPPTSGPRVTLSTPRGDITVGVEVVQSEPMKERGLMFRRYLAPDDGMLFLMGEERDWSFWMRNTLIPLDMIFITKDMTVAGVSANAEPMTETSRAVGKPSLYVLEVNGGYAAQHGVIDGARVQFLDTAAAAK